MIPRAMSAAIRSMQHAELAALVRDPTQVSGRDYQVVDVRDDDFAGGNIPGAVNVPSHTLSDPTVFDSIVRSLAGVKRIVFHCALSQQRGPKAAMRMAAPLQLGGSDVYVLVGGFSRWQQAYKDEPDLLENYDEAMWKSEWWQ
ncbi:Rhodanese-like domain-containing protein [Blastocladiella britannica]|nr:Rhodanese-like domain-containing protein [Blastocladiella britannica]